MNAIGIRAAFVAAACACLFTPFTLAQTPAKATAKGTAATGPWARVPAFPTGCYQNVAPNTADPFYANLEAAKAAVTADRERQVAINAQIEQEFNSIDPMEMAQRMQQWMMSNPQGTRLSGVSAVPQLQTSSGR